MNELDDVADKARVIDLVVSHTQLGIEGMILQLKKEKKTYVERRGLLHSVKSNLRVFTIYICMFHLIVTVAHFVPFEQDTVPLCPPQTRTDSCKGVYNETQCGGGCAWGQPPDVLGDGVPPDVHRAHCHRL